MKAAHRPKKGEGKPTNSGVTHYGTGAAADVRVLESSGRPDKGTKLVPLSKGGNDRAVARLKRDNPDLAERVIRGELSANGAAADVRVMARRGEVGNGRSRGDIGASTLHRGNDLASTVARLKRDHPDLAERVIRGELSASADRRLQSVAPAAMSSNQASPDAPESTQQSRVMPCPKDKKSPARWRGKQEIAVG